MTRFIKKIQHFRLKLHQRDTFKTQFVDTLFSTISKHLPFNSISTKFSPRLVSNHACEFLVGTNTKPRWRNKEISRNRSEKTDTERRGKFIQQTSNPSKDLHLKIQNQIEWRIRLKFYYLIREREREKRKQYILNKEYLGKNNRPIICEYFI